MAPTTPFILVVDFNNRGGGATHFLNYLISWYKTTTQFLIIRPTAAPSSDAGATVISLYLNDEFQYAPPFSVPDFNRWLTRFCPLITRIFINHLFEHSPDTLQHLTTLGRPIVSITHDYQLLIADTPQPQYNEIDSLHQHCPPIIPLNKQLLLTQHPITQSLYKRYTSSTQLVVMPDYRKSGERIDMDVGSTNDPIVIAIVGYVNRIKGLSLLTEIIDYFRVSNSKVQIVLIGFCPAYWNNCQLEQRFYHNIYEFNSLLQYYRPQLLLEIGDWPETYSYTLSLQMLTQLPILYRKKKFDSVVEARLSTYQKAYPFTTLTELESLLQYRQSYFYTVKPVITIPACWDAWFLQ